MSVVLVFSLAVFGMLLNLFIVSSSGQWFAKDFMIKKEKVVFCENVFSNLTAGDFNNYLNEFNFKFEKLGFKMIKIIKSRSDEHMVTTHAAHQRIFYGVKSNLKIAQT